MSFSRSSRGPAACVVVLALGAGLCAGLLPATLAAAQPGYHEVPLPDGPVGDRLRQVVEVFGGTDEAKQRDFILHALTDELRASETMEEHMQDFSVIWEGSRGFDVVGLRIYDDGRVGGEEIPPNRHTVIVRNELTEEWQAFVVDLEPEPPHRVAAVQYAPARPPAEAPPEPPLASDAAMVAELSRFVDHLVAADAFSGTVLLAKDGEVLYQGAFGLANRSYDVPNRLDTKLNLGSMNKMFTAVAIGQLVEAGKVAWDDPLSKYLGEDWLPKEVTDKIQIRHLLSHTSGLGSYFNDTFMDASRLRFREIEDYKPLVADDRPAFEPGTDWSYSNTGFLLLGKVVEVASGESYFDYVRQHVYAPAGMSDSDCFDLDRPVPNLAIGYFRQGGEWVTNTFLHVVRGGPAGGGYSTAPDLLRFARALRAGKLVSKQTLAILTTPKPELHSPGYGYGFGIAREGAERSYGHSGGFPGINSNLRIFDAGYVAIYMSNAEGASRAVGQKMDLLIHRRTYPRQ
jgi:CubicO group peptidase (beta-lactamase class C family)